jgi:hypothetical protein
MNQKWRILIGICLVVMVCMPVVTASIQLPTIKNSFTQSLSDRLNFIGSTQYARDNIRMPQGLPDFQVPSPSENIRKSDFSAIPDNPNESMTIRSIFEKFRTSGTSPQSGTYISKEEAIDIATARFPDICLMEPITASLKKKNIQSHPNWVNPYWVVTINGYNPEGDPCDLESCFFDENVMRDYFSYGGIVFIDAISGEILDIYRPS